MPLILGNHGGGDEVRQFVDEMGLLALAGNERVAVVAADHQSLPNDVRGPALTALVKYMLATYPALDPSRVYAIGYSMGGGATYTVGYYEPSLFAAIAPIAGTNIEPTAAEVARFGNTPTADIPFDFLLRRAPPASRRGPHQRQSGQPGEALVGLEWRRAGQLRL